jgi:glycosidase
MNLIDSHDTERALWTLTPGVQTRAAKEQNAANLASGKARLRLASLIQFTVPGMPTIYYGDEAGVTGDDDPDDRRTYPWPDTGGTPDTELIAHYRALAALRRAVPALTAGDIRFLLADNRAGVVAYARSTASSKALVVLNRSTAARTVSVPVTGLVANGTALQPRFGGGAAVTVTGGKVQVSVAALSGAVLTTGEG